MGVPTGVTEELALERDFELPVLLSPKAAEERGENHFVEEEVMEPSPLQPKPQSVADFAKWQLLALGAHIGWGCYPVLARRLQNPAVMPEGVEPIPVLQLLFVLNIIASMWLALYLALGALYNRWIGAGQTADQDQRAQWSIKTTWVTITLCVVQFARPSLGRARGHLSSITRYNEPSSSPTQNPYLPFPARGAIARHRGIGRRDARCCDGFKPSGRAARTPAPGKDAPS